MLRRLRPIRFQADPIVDSVAETLFAAQIPLRCLHRDVSQQELNLLQFTAGLKLNPLCMDGRVGSLRTAIKDRIRSSTPMLVWDHSALILVHNPVAVLVAVCFLLRAFCCETLQR